MSDINRRYYVIEKSNEIKNKLLNDGVYTNELDALIAAFTLVAFAYFKKNKLRSTELEFYTETIKDIYIGNILN